MHQITTNITEMIKENEEDIRRRIQEQVTDAVSKGFQDFSQHMLELEKEDKLLCVQCDEVRSAPSIYCGSMSGP